MLNGTRLLSGMKTSASPVGKVSRLRIVGITFGCLADSFLGSCTVATSSSGPRVSCSDLTLYFKDPQHHRCPAESSFDGIRYYFQMFSTATRDVGVRTAYSDSGWGRISS